jgi:hypothetical protein
MMSQRRCVHSTASGKLHSTASGKLHSTASGKLHSTASGKLHSTASGKLHSTASSSSIDGKRAPWRSSRRTRRSGDSDFAFHADGRWIGERRWLCSSRR